MNNVDKHAKNKNNIILIITIVVIVLLLIGGAYGYFKAKTDGQKSIPIKVTTNTVDSLMFMVTDSGGHLEGTEGFIPLNIILNKETMSEDATQELSGLVKAQAKLIPANTPNNNITKNYYLSLYISQNNFVYSISPDKPEILMKVYKKESPASSYTEVTTLPDGTTRKTVTNKDNQTITGFDITTKTGLVNIANAKPISATTNGNGVGSAKEDDWKVEIIFVNYNASQNENAEKGFYSSVIIGKEANVTLASHIKSLPPQNGKGGAGLYYHNGTIKDGNTILDANDGSYRYAGADTSVHNYVCIKNEEPCSDNNMYRIIGVFDGKVKLIKATPLKNNSGEVVNISWDPARTGYEYGSNTWSTSKLKKGLNGETDGDATAKAYYNSYIQPLVDSGKIEINHHWSVGGNTYDNIYNSIPSVAYHHEVESPSGANSEVNPPEKYWDGKVGLMYASDYGFAALPGTNNWNTILFNYRGELHNSDWLWDSENWQWTISRCSGASYNVFYVNRNGLVTHCNAHILIAVRPAFYLESNVGYSGGTGTHADPYILG